MNMQTLSIVVPVYSGEKFISALFEEIHSYRSLLEAIAAPIQVRELIFVMDDPVDGSHEIISEISHAHDWVITLNLSRNFGQHQATVAGILHSSSDWVVTMDEDLQHHPRHLQAILL